MVVPAVPTLIALLVFALETTVAIQKENPQDALIAVPMGIVLLAIKTFTNRQISVTRVRAEKQVCQNLLVSRIVVHPVVGAVLLAMNAQVDRA